MLCPLCKGNMSNGFSDMPYRLDANKRVVLIDVPALVCDQCGDEFIDIETVRKVERILLKVKQDGINMGFIDYPLAA